MAGNPFPTPGKLAFHCYASLCGFWPEADKRVNDLPDVQLATAFKIVMALLSKGQPHPHSWSLTNSMDERSTTRRGALVRIVKKDRTSPFFQVELLDDDGGLCWSKSVTAQEMTYIQMILSGTGWHTQQSDWGNWRWDAHPPKLPDAYAI
jgi:hypothetical protein